MRIQFFILAISLSITTIAQEKKLNTLTFDQLLHAGINPAGELYTVSSKQLGRYDKDGKLLRALDLVNAQEITQFDSWHLTQIILYHRAVQRIDIYNPELDLRNTFTLDSSFAIEPQWVAASFDQQHIWIFDGADQSVKKVNYKTDEVVVDVVISKLTSNTKILGMREYQRFLFLRTDNALLIFNGLGNMIRTIPIKITQNFDFFGEEIFFLENKTIAFSSLFAKEERQINTIIPFNKVMLSDERLFGWHENTLDIFEFNPQ